MWEIMWRFLSSCFSFLLGFFTWPAPPRPPQTEIDIPPAKVAIIGAGIGGCFAAKFLRENGGGKLDIHVFAKKGSKIGGRTAVCQFDGHVYETGASVIHSDNEYLVDAAKQHDLDTKIEMGGVPVGIFNGKSLFRISSNKIVQSVQMLWRFGFDLFRMNSFVSGLLKKFRTIYDLQKDGKAYANVEDLVAAMGGQQMSDLMKISASDYMCKELHWNEALVNELVVGALRMNYGQDAAVDTFTASVALAGMQNGSLWSVVGGNYKIAECVLKGSGSSLVMEDVVSVTKAEGTGSVKYTIATGDGKTDEGYDVVIVANPLNVSVIKYNNFTNTVYTAAATTPYQRTVATFYKGKINQQFFGETADLANFPQVILTTDMQSPPFSFNSVAVQVPSEIQQNEVDKYQVPLQDDPVKVWKVFSRQPLTQEQCLSLFPEIDDTAHFDWLAYPQYHAPYQAPSFILDDGVFYINAIEMAASAMEMSAIGAKNAALLTKDYLLQ